MTGVGAESGREVWGVGEAHSGGVTAVVTLDTPTEVVSAGQDGKVWYMGHSSYLYVIYIYVKDAHWMRQLFANILALQFRRKKFSNF